MLNEEETLFFSVSVAVLFFLHIQLAGEGYETEH